jgi:hypothetical protein
MQPANTLYAKVLLKKQPYSQNVISIVICASTAPNITKANAPYYTELPLQVTTLDQIHAKVHNFQTWSNTASVSLSIHAKVFEHLFDVA